MRPFWIAFLILGFFQPLVIQAQPFGTTDVTVYDTDFLPVPEGPPPETPDEAPMPAWVALPIPTSELPS